MRREEQESLVEALSYCALRELPNKDDGDGYWLEAIARVAKRDGTHSYAYAARDIQTLEPCIKKDFGSVSGIAFVEDYYPYEYLRDEFAVKLSTKESKVEYLSSIDADNAKAYAKMSVKKLDEEIIRRCIIAQQEFDNKTIYHG
jgi:hypothetical protein